MLDDEVFERELFARVKSEYQPRVIDERVSSLMAAFGGLLILGPKWCGKSWTGVYHSKSIFFVGDEDSAALAAIDPSLALMGEQPRLIDEWQEVPKLWDIARRDIDFSGKKGAYIFTGSSIPPEKSTHHSGTGRFARIRMRTLSSFESGDSNGAISLSWLFAGNKLINTQSGMSYKKIVDLICRGGWPAALGRDEQDSIDIPYMYLESVIDSDLYRLDGKGRDQNLLKLVLESLARNLATTARLSVIIEDISENGGKISENTLRDYINALKMIFVIEEQQAWTTALRSRARIRTTSKRHFADPSLAAAALNAKPEILIKDARTVGIFFESLGHRDLCVYAEALKGNVYHYHDSTELEVDEIVELSDGRWGAIEVKLGKKEFDDAAKKLLALKEKVGNGREPSFLMILCATGGLAYTREDGVLIVPIDLLGP
ncbi:MAG: DUF4143 domain-containing protein [Methanomassiliicoccaceae archaeon]|nr:DUF4143 domain-containing protein [Methanomassiliicoccaceae archaeon]